MKPLEPLVLEPPSNPYRTPIAPHGTLILGPFRTPTGTLETHHRILMLRPLWSPYRNLRDPLIESLC